MNEMKARHGFGHGGIIYLPAVLLDEATALAEVKELKDGTEPVLSLCAAVIVQRSLAPGAHMAVALSKWPKGLSTMGGLQ